MMDGVELTPCSGVCEGGYEYDASRQVVTLLGSDCARYKDGETHRVWFDER
ncbi:MAG: hypothetical protein HY791_20800 [Deltaproteobacteria bacterium]|nr:hypothetical protein [Deltaproteobacteria bacterium]